MIVLVVLILSLWLFAAVVHAIGSSGRSHVEESPEQQVVRAPDNRTHAQRRAQFMARGF